jgi:glutamate--cysteine ligase
VNGHHAALADVAARADAAFTPSAEVRIGAEVEWLVFDRSDLTRRIDASDAARTASGELPAGGTVTIEPGGQVELVTPPHDGPRSLIDAIESDTAALANRFAEHDLALVPLGLDPIRDPVRTLEVERYKAMERHFLDVSPAGVQMMNLTASLQLNIDFGPDPVQTWQRAHAIAPLLAAAFVNSPTTDGTEFQPISHRMRIWAATDPTRTRPADPDPSAWGNYILDARVIPGSATHTFRDWLAQPTPPTVDDLDRHIATLFPPVRPRGYLEFRMLDALPAIGRRAAVATVWALMTDHGIGDVAFEAAHKLDDPWGLVYERGPGHTELHETVAHLLDLSARSVRPIDPRLANAVTTWSERPSPARPDDVGDWVLGAAEPT